MSTSISQPSKTCVAAATAILGDKWTPLIITALSSSSMRFCQLQETVGGVNPRTLSARLTALEHNKIVSKEPSHDTAHDHYTLSQRGQDLLPIIYSMHKWGEKHPAN